MQSLSLFELTQEQLEIAEMIDQPDELDEIDEAVLKISQEQFVEKSGNYISIITHFNAEVAKFKELKAQVDVAIKRKERVVEKLKQNLTDAITVLGPKEIGIYKLSLRKSESVIIEDPNSIPDELMDKKLVVSPNKTKIKAALKKGEVSGASLQTKQNLQIR